MMYCKHCGASLESATKFCTACGKSVQEEPERSSLPAEPKSHASLWFKSLLLLIALIIGTFLTTTLLTEDVTDTVKDQLQAIRNGQITEAYYAFASKKFQETTSLEAFSDFMKKHSAFSESKSIHFKERNVNDDIGTLEGTITAHNDKKIQVEYKLIKESEKWKILSIRIEDLTNVSTSNSPKNQKRPPQPTQLNPASLLSFNQFVLSNTFSPSGIVGPSSTLFKVDSGDIYLNLHVTGADTKSKIRVIFKHIDSQSTLNPITTHAVNDGDSILSFVFSPPEQGWPKGNYRIQASSANGVKGSFDFHVE